MKKFNIYQLIGFLFILLFSNNIKANDPLLDSAKSNYDNGAFAMATEQYESVISKGFTSSDLHYNLGNAYFRNGQIGLSILNFEKAIKLDGSNENAVFNLELANTKLTDKFEAVPEVSVAVILRSLNSVIPHNIISIVAALLLLAAAGLFIYGKKEKIRKHINLSRILLFSGIVITLIGWKQLSSVEEYKAGIVISPSTNVFSEPNENSTLLFEIHEGTKLEILSETDSWINVQAPNNEVGWISKTVLKQI